MKKKNMLERTQDIFRKYDLKVIITSLSLICSTAFGLGLWIGKTSEQVKTNIIKSECVKSTLEKEGEISICKLEVERIEKSKSLVEQQKMFYESFCNYLLSKRNYSENPNKENLDKLNSSQKRFEGYLK